MSWTWAEKKIYQKIYEKKSTEQTKQNFSAIVRNKIDQSFKASE